jgi:capsular exopolysaccharide synthesis family protein
MEARAVQSPKHNTQPRYKSDLSNLVRHYGQLFGRWKWYMLLLGPSIAVLMTLLLIRTGTLRPELSATVILGQEGPTQLIAPPQGVDNYAVQLLRSRAFLGTITQRLSLRIELDNNHTRAQLFDSVQVDSLAPEGRYVVSIYSQNGGQYSISHTPFDKEASTTLIHAGELSTFDKLAFKGFRAILSSRYRQAPHDFAFSITSQRHAVERLLSTLSVEGPDIRRNIHFVKLSVSGKDYGSISQIANTIADEFVRANLQLKKRRTLSTLDNLQIQLQRAEEQLNASQSELRAFLSRYPSVALVAATEQTIGEMVTIEAQNYTTDNTLARARQLHNQLRTSEPQKRAETAQMGLAFLASAGNATAMVVQQNLTTLLAQKSSQLSTHAADHPVLQQTTQQVEQSVARAEALLGEYIASNRDQHQQRQSALKELSSQLHALPAKQLQLADLRRKQQVDEQLYTTVLSRLNEAKVAEAVAVSDIFIIDRAAPPIAPAPLINFLRLLAIGLAIGLGGALLPPIVYDFIDRTARSEYQLAKLSELPVLEAIPIITTSASGQKLLRSRVLQLEASEQTLQPTLPATRTREHWSQSVDAGVILLREPEHIANEFFRSLRTKIDLALSSRNAWIVVFSSLNMSEGKSLIAANSAVAFAQQGKRTLLIDADMRRGIQHQYLGAAQHKGLSDLLAGVEKLSTQSLADTIQPLPQENLFMISCGQYPSNPVELLSSKRLQELLPLLKQHFDLLIFDTPPLGVGADVVILHTLNPLFVMVAKAGSTNILELEKRIDEYHILRKSLPGLVLNFSESDCKAKYYKHTEYYSQSAANKRGGV